MILEIDIYPTLLIDFNYKDILIMKKKTNSPILNLNHESFLERYNNKEWGVNMSEDITKFDKIEEWKN